MHYEFYHYINRSIFISFARSLREKKKIVLLMYVENSNAVSCMNCCTDSDGDSCVREPQPTTCHGPAVAMHRHERAARVTHID